MTERKQTFVPTPGSPSARDRGCTCPVMDNHNGRGVNGQFWISEKCPVHGLREEDVND